MKDSVVVLETSIRNSGFSALLCSTLGFAMLEAWILRLGIRPTVHMVAISVGAVFATVIYRTVLPSCQTKEKCASQQTQFSPIRPTSADGAVCAALLVAFGYSSAVILSRGSMLIFAGFAACASLFPWSAFALCRTRISVSLTLVSLAAVIGMLMLDVLSAPFLPPLAVWMLWMAAVGAWVRNIILRRRHADACIPSVQRPVQDPASVL